MGKSKHLSHEVLGKMVSDKKITGGCFAAQRQVVFIMEASSNEEVGSILADLRVWPLIRWRILPIQSFKSADERDSK